MVRRWIAALVCVLATACSAAAAKDAESPAAVYGGSPGGMAVSASPPADAPMAPMEGSADSGGGDYDEPASAPPPQPARTSGSTGRELLAQAQPKPEPKKQIETKPTGKKGETASDAVVALQPMLIYTATLTMAVFEVARSIGQVEDLGRSLGGFLARRDDTTITIRVPAGRFEEAIKHLEKMGDVVHRNVTAEDVTEEFLDLEVRLKNARAVRDRLEQLLAKAAKVEESLLIQRELDRVAGEIERIEGRLKFLRDRVAFSTITVTFQPRRAETVGSERFNLPVPWLYELGLRRLLSL